MGHIILPTGTTPLTDLGVRSQSIKSGRPPAAEALPGGENEKGDYLDTREIPPWTILVGQKSKRDPGAEPLMVILPLTTR